MLYRLISDFTWHVSTGPEKENLIFSLVSATPGREDKEHKKNRRRSRSKRREEEEEGEYIYI